MYGKGENSYKRCNKDLISKMYKQLIQLNHKKNKQSNKKMGRRPKQTFLQRHMIWMASRHMKKCSTLLILGEMQIKTTMRYHLIPLRMATFNKSTNNKCWRGCGEKETLLHCWWECKLVQPL